LGKFATNTIGAPGVNADFGEVLAKGVATAIAGGVGSVIAGGKFENGAMTAAYGYLFNAVARWTAFRDAKEQAGIPRSTNTDYVDDVPLLNRVGATKYQVYDPKTGLPVMTREYHFKNGDVVIREHSAGHVIDGKLVEKGHFNVVDRHGNTLPNTKPHIDFQSRLDPMRDRRMGPTGMYLPRSGSE
jgi:hypothetical protein